MGKIKIDNSGYISDRKALFASIRKEKQTKALHEDDNANANANANAKVTDKKKKTAKKVSPTHVLDLSVNKLPTETVHTLSKRSKYHEDAVYPNSSGPSRCLFNGPSGSGKTNFCLSLLCDVKHMSGFFDKIYVFCPSAQLQSDYTHLESRYKVPTELEILDFGPAIVQQKWDETQSIFMKCREKHTPLPQTLFLFDDLINVPGFDKCASTLMTKARHSGISVWVITQGFMTLSRLMRLQASNVFAFSPTESEIIRLAQDCTNALADEIVAEKIIRHATRERFNPFHFNRHAPLSTQYRKGLNEIFELFDPAEGIHTDTADEEKDKSDNENETASILPKTKSKSKSK